MLDSAVKIKERFVSFADMFRSTRNIYVSKLNLEDRFLRRSATCVQTSVYLLPAVTEVERLISVFPTFSVFELNILRRYFK